MMAVALIERKTSRSLDFATAERYVFLTEIDCSVIPFINAQKVVR